MGSMAGQLHRGDVRGVRVTYAGEITEYPLAAVTASTVTGLLKTALGPEVNPVSASFLVKERGIEVVEEKKSKASDFVNAITLQVTGNAATTEIVGALFGQDERIVGVNGFRLEVIPKGHMILTIHRDRPGIVGRIGSILGQHRVNISHLTLGKQASESDLAKAMISIDGPIDEKVLAEITQIDGIESARLLHLD
jgi:D-3-phosphoglycerate dehydrogenase